MIATDNDNDNDYDYDYDYVEHDEDKNNGICHVVFSDNQNDNRIYHIIDIDDTFIYCR